MQAFSIDGFVARVQGGEPAAAWLAHVGEPEPDKAAAAVAAAGRHPDLALTVAVWGPALLASARPGFAAQTLVELADRYRGTRGRPLDVAQFPRLPGLLGNSDFLARLLLRHPHWVEHIPGDEPPAPDGAVDPDWTAIRIAKYQGLLRIVARDLAGRAMPDSLRELSALADACLGAALECAAAAESAPAPVLFALGKLGGGELNFSSDVDLLFLYEPDPAVDALAERERLTRVVQRFAHHLGVRSEDGFAYRVDLDLRPEGSAGVVINSVDAALSYYESFGADWERQMLIRLRYLGGPAAPAQAFRAGIEPFVFRRGIDPRAIRGIREMKTRIEGERRAAGRDLETDLKEGPGGIRDVEFFAQAFQLLHAGRFPQLRGASVADVLSRLAELELIPLGTMRGLRDGYLWLRRAEHAVQLAEERQVHRFPREKTAQLALARRMGYADWSAEAARARLLDDWVRVRAEVRRHFDALVLGAGDG
jgi:[glutamine synthetase] adenylyltransferase / [glutamine synthetase]-adenylyl-L-tyrosine phosphorylase